MTDPALLLFIAGLLTGVGLTILAAQARDLPWLLWIIYRFLRYRTHPNPNDIPPSVRPYHQAIIAALRRQGRLA